MTRKLNKTLRWCKTAFGKEIISKESTDYYLQDCVKNNNVIAAYRHGCHVAQHMQKAIDEAKIKELESIVELAASVMGIGTKWFSLAAKMDATMELREKIREYYK